MRHFSATLLPVVFLMGVVMPQNLGASETCPGAPFTNVSRPRAIEESAGTPVGPQIFDIAVHPRGFVLMANNNGLLSYDGVGFRLMPLGRSVVALSVAVGPDGRMFAGGSRTFGEVIEDPTGLLLYQPLETQLPPTDRVFSDVWQTLVSKEGIAYFRTLERLIVVGNSGARAFVPVGRFTAAILLDGVLYAHDSGLGTVRLGPGGFVPARGGEFFKTVRVTALATGKRGSLLVGTQDRGLFRLDPETGLVTPLGASQRDLGGAEILSVRQIDDDSIAVGTLRRGLFLLNASGTAFRMDMNRGLPDNAILSLQTSPGSLWAGTSGGVAQLLLPGSIESFSTRDGLPGIVESLVRHDGSIYAATSQGVFRLTCGDEAFEAVASLRKQSFALMSAGSLLAATAEGILEMNGAGTRLVRPGLARSFGRSKDPETIWLATQTGVAALSRVKGTWSAEPPVTFENTTSGTGEVANVEATSIAEGPDGRLWFSLVTGQVASALPTRAEGRWVLSAVRVLGESEGVSAGFAEVMALKEGIRIGTANAVLMPQGGGVVPDARFTSALGLGRGAFRIEDALEGGYWLASSKRPLLLTRGKDDGSLSPRSTALLRTPAGSRILDFLEVSKEEVWIGTDDGAFRYNPMRDVHGAAPVQTYVRRVESQGAELLAGGPVMALETELPHLAPLRFEVASSSLDDPSRNRFRFRLDGQDADWSNWTAETRKDYTNLGPGVYRFRAETRDVYGRIGQEAGLTFVVATPWYRKWWALTLGLAVFAGAFLFALELRTRALRKRQGELEALVDQKTRELREASFTDPLTGLRNRRYFAEVMGAEASLACRADSPALHLFLVDLDHFKQVNDTYGHAAGDEVLRQTSARMLKAMRTSDLLFRWGGEEFLIVARGSADLPRNEIAQRIVRLIAQEPFDIRTDAPLARTCSVGFATYPFFPASPQTVPFDAVVELADLALYRAKETGRNRAVGISPQTGVPIPGDVWRNEILSNLEKVAVSVEVLEGPLRDR